ncbi:sensor histidine kinase [Castellaniella hirudinis]|uniref:sensor histidine kinase n=1 Tax=Castellaniella hirudinis TaxID=1144617 RepID=UPI0039C3AAA6
MKIPDFAPGRRLLAAAVFGVLLIIALVYMAQSRPWLGLHLAWSHQDQAAIVLAHQGPGAHIPVGSQLVAIQGGGDIHRFSALDFIVEPDGNVRTYPEYHQFLKNMGQLADIQDAPRVQLSDRQGRIFSLTPAPWRPLWTLPVDFWVQVAVGLIAWLIVSAVWAFRPRQSGVRYLLFNGATTLMFAPGAAVYTTRELAIPLSEMIVLKTMNFGGGLMFCASFTALLLVYPRRLAPAWLGLLILSAYALWFVAQAFGAFDSVMLGRRVPVFAALIASTALALIQWLRAYRDPIARAALRWFLLSWLVGVSLFVLLIMVPQIIEVDTGRLQGYSFLLFLLMYGGIALGVLRYRLFDLGLWWFRAIAWVVGALALVGLDLLLVFGLQLPSGWSLSLSLLVCALLWLPFRNWLWARLVSPPVPPGNLFNSVTRVALAPSADECTRRWKALLQAQFAPLEIQAVAAQEQVTLGDDGLSLSFPAAAHAPALRLRYPGQGRRLFSSLDLARARQISAMLAYAEESREAYAQGAREERQRIAQDLHDDLGAILLSGLHQRNLDQAHDSLTQAMGEMRVIVQGLSGEQHPWAAVQADLRSELANRLEAAGIQLDWRDRALDPGLQLDYVVFKHLTSVLRELISNVIRHAQASRVAVDIQCDQGALILSVSDNGCGLSADRPDCGGHGLANLRRRLDALGGSVRALESTRQGTALQLFIPLEAGRNT